MVVDFAAPMFVAGAILVADLIEVVPVAAAVAAEVAAAAVVVVVVVVHYCSSSWVSSFAVVAND